MTIRASKLTPQAMLSAPRRQAGVPNSDGSQVLYQISNYSFETQEESGAIKLLDVETKETKTVTDDKEVSNPTWVTDNFVAFLRGRDDGQTDLLFGSIKDALEHDLSNFGSVPIGGAASDLKIVNISQGHFAVAFTAPANLDGSMHNAEKAPKRKTTGKLYSSLFVRHWDTYRTPQYKAIWFTTMTLVEHLTKSDPQTLSVSTDFVNAFDGTNLSVPEPFGGADTFDISRTGLAFVAKDPNLNPALHTKSNLYFMPTNFEHTGPLTELSKAAEKPGFVGASSSPVFSPSGKSVAALRMGEDGYESDKNGFGTWSGLPGEAERLDYIGGLGLWPFSPSSIAFSSDEKSLYITAEKFGAVHLFHETPGASNPTKLTPGSASSVSDFRVLQNGKIFVTASSFIDSSIYYTIDPSQSPATSTQISSLSHNGNTFGLSADQVTEIWFPGAGKNSVTNDQVHAWIIKPPHFSADKKYPLAILIHGGPQGSWTNSWSTRWNAAVFAAQGYVVALPDPTGSTGYGQEFVDAIRGDWGGKPYGDIVNCFDYIRTKLDYVDSSRTVAAGASFGGYMANWIQGHALGRFMKALVTHDGTTCLTTELSTDELYFVNRDLGGSWLVPENRETWKKWDPSQFAQYWDTPHLIIHSEKDYRLLMADGMAAFNLLQMRGVESQFLTFSDENHWVLKHENSLVWHRAVLSWLNKHVGLPAYEEEELEKEVRMDPPRQVTKGIEDLKIRD